MPLHDWTDRGGWYGLSLLWITGMTRDLTPRLPDGDRAVLGWEYWYGDDSDPKEKDVFVGVERAGRRVAAVELVPPEYGHLPAVRSRYDRRLADHIRGRVHLLLVDVHPRPTDGRRIAGELPGPVPPAVASYRVPDPADGGAVAVWQYPLAVGEPLPTVTLRLSADETIPLDLEATYSEAARLTYIR